MSYFKITNIQKLQKYNKLIQKVWKNILFYLFILHFEFF